MERQLVINADDFGMTDGVSRGVIRAFDEGVVTSASLFANMPGFETAAALARARPRLGVGLHLNLTDGVPVLPREQVPTLVGDDGRFLGYRTFSLRLLSGRIDRGQLTAEIRAQLGRIEQAGLRASHVDGHRHIHLLPVLFDIVAELTAAAGIRYLRCPAAVGDRALPAGIGAARTLGLAGFGRLHYGRLADRGLSTADCFLGALSRGKADSLADSAARLSELPAGLTEWMVHPGEVDAELVFVDDYLWPRTEQLAWLTSEEAQQAVDAAGCRLVSFRGEPKLRVAPDELESRVA